MILSNQDCRRSADGKLNFGERKLENRRDELQQTPRRQLAPRGTAGAASDALTARDNPTNQISVCFWSAASADPIAAVCRLRKVGKRNHTFCELSCVSSGRFTQFGVLYQVGRTDSHLPQSSCSPTAQPGAGSSLALTNSCMYPVSVVNTGVPQDIDSSITLEPGS